ncbi:DUF6262 family protein [Streptomyces sp. NPDC059352]|uniref:DUF6262 family protein n=1 Tax=Streptomyces sp. NPDC059352 TaxID=3346810 RepID=UPI0036B973D4
MTTASTSTTAAIAARRRQTQDKLAQLDKAVSQLRRERRRLTVRGIAERAGVSATFCYENQKARALVQRAIADVGRRHDGDTQQEHDRIEASWRERALNAEDALTRTQQTVFAQRQQIGELMGQLRDTEQTVPGDFVQTVLAENVTLKHRLDQITREHRSLQERLEGTRSNLRFAEKRIADLEIQILEQDPP